MKKAAESDPALALGVNTIDGKLTYQAVAKEFKLKYIPLSEAI